MLVGEVMNLGSRGLSAALAKPVVSAKHLLPDCGPLWRPQMLLVGGMPGPVFLFLLPRPF
jgi:hypothetical protein